MSEIKNTVDGINEQLGIAKVNISELEDIIMGSTK